MKFLIVALSLVACACATSDSEAVVSQYEYVPQPDGSFVYKYETSNGIGAQVSGHVETLGKDEVALKVSGSNQYISPEGQTIELSYVADETGYHPTGSHLPTPPPPEPIPEYIAKSLEYIAAHPYTEKN